MNMFESIVKLNDRQVRYALEKQVRDSNSRHFGGIPNMHTGIPSPSHGGTAGYIASLASALIVPESDYYKDESVLEALDRAVQYMLNRQHSDGTISLGGTNFHSPPDTSFVVTGLCQVYRVLERQLADWEQLRPIYDKLRIFLERTIPALLTGGCHTPNHRWVITAALGSLYEIFNKQELVARADEWLAEGMDCTADGEWTERSNGIYNTVSNIMLYYTAKFLDRPALLEHVRRNLRMMVYMVHHDGKVVTDYSDRQDFGVPHDLSEYFLSYRLMAVHDRDPLFAAMHDLVARTMSRVGPVNNHALLGMLRFPCEEEIAQLERAPLPERYEKMFNAEHPIDEHLAKIEQAGHHSRILHSRLHTAFGAPVVRYREGKTSVTMMSRTASFFSLRHGAVKLHGIRVSTLFSPGIVYMDKLQRESGGYKLYAKMEKGYNGPISAQDLPETSTQSVSPWYLLPHHKRALTHVQEHRIEIDIMRSDRDWTIRLHTDDLEDVLTQVVFLFDMDNKLSIKPEAEQSAESESVDQQNQLVAHSDRLLFWKQGVLHCESGEDWLQIESGQYDHQLTASHGIDTSLPGIQTVAVNLLSPYEKTFRIRLSE